MRKAQWVLVFCHGRSSGEALQIERSNTTKIVIATVCLVAALAIWYFTGSTARQLRAERIAAAKGIIYRVQCDSCGFVGEMPADEFVAEQDKTGRSICPKCGAQTVRQLGLAGSDPSQFQSEVDSISSVGEVEEAIDIAQERLQKVIDELDAKPQDPARLDALRRERAMLEAKLQALNIRWSVILDPSRAPDS